MTSPRLELFSHINFGNDPSSWPRSRIMYIIVLNVVKFDAITTTGCDDVDFRIYARFTKFLVR